MESASARALVLVRVLLCACAICVALLLKYSQLVAEAEDVGIARGARTCCCCRSITQTRATYGGLCGMPACGQAVGCGVCDTPELWCGAAALCARVRACAGAAESLHTYIRT